MKPETRKIPNMLDYMHKVAMDTHSHVSSVPNHLYNLLDTAKYGTIHVGKFVMAIPYIIFVF